MKLVLFLTLMFPLGAVAADAAREGAPSPADPQLYVVGTAHLDTQWRWTIRETIDEYIPATMRRNFELFARYPDYVFSFEGAFRYMLMKEYYPAAYDSVRQFVRSGRWKVAGSWVDAVDTNIPSPESLVRQTLLGNGFFRRELGVTSRDVFLPDCFGFGYALPSIAAHCGLTGFSTQKLTWGSSVGVPFDIGMWEGVDGSRLVSALNPGAYVAEAKSDLSADSAVVATVQHQGSISALKAAYKYIGTGDQGGAPTDSSVLWLEESIRRPRGPVRVRSVASDQLARDVSAMPPEVAASLPLYKGELLMTRHGAGCYTSEAAMKRWNRRNERLADAAERASVVAAWLGASRYPIKTFDQAWTRFLWHQFHDDLTGTSIPQAYTYSWNDEAISANQFAGILEHAAGAVARSLGTRAKGVPVVVYNPLSIEREDVVDATVLFPGDMPKEIRVIGPGGKEVPSQMAAAAAPDARALKVAFLARVPPVGFAVYDVQPAESKGKRPGSAAAGGSPRNDLAVTDSTLSNSRYRIVINRDGDIASIYDRRYKREILSAPIRLQMLDDTPRNWAAWEIDYAAETAPPREFVGGPVRRTVVENGPVRAAIEIVRRAGGSTFRQLVRLAAGGQRIEVVNDIDWRTQATLLKAAFTLAVAADSATYDLGLGTIRRPTDTEKKYEVPAQQWADLSGRALASGAQSANPAALAPEYGVAILNDCKYGWDKPDDHTLRLTLIHTPGVNSRWQWIGDQSTMDLGRHQATFAIFGHAGEGRAEVGPEADRLNQPLIAFQLTLDPEAKARSASPAGRRDRYVYRPRPLENPFSFVHVSNAAVMVRALKQAEESDEIIVRMEETSGRAVSRVVLTFAAPIVEAREVNGAEEEVGPCPAGVGVKPGSGKSVSGARTGSCDLRDGGIVADFRPYQPRTFAVRLASPPPGARAAKRPVTQALALPYNLVGITPHGRPNRADFDGAARTLPGELLPDTVVCQGVPFATGPRGDGEANVLACRGETLPLPSGNFNRIHLLACATGGDRIGTFRAGPLALDLPIQDGEEPIAQWDNRVAGEELITDPAQIEPAYTKNDQIAWVGTHRHRQDGGCDSYAFFYLYKYSIDLPPDARSITLPNDPRIRIAAITLADDPNTQARIATEVIDRPRATLVRIVAPGSQFLDSMRVVLTSPLRGAVIRYTTDGSAPGPSSPEYHGPILLTGDTTIRARALDSALDDSFVASRAFTRLELQDAVAGPARVEPGLDAGYFEGSWKSVSEFDQQRPARTGAVATVEIPSFARPENFGLTLSGFIRIPADGLYRFHLSSDDGSVLFVGREKVVDNDGPHSETEKAGAVALRAGLHPIRIGYFNGVGDEALRLRIEGPGLALRPVPPEMLGH